MKKTHTIVFKMRKKKTGDIKIKINNTEKKNKWKQQNYLEYASIQI